MRDRLIELISQRIENKTWTVSDLADYLLANGVMVVDIKVVTNLKPLQTMCGMPLDEVAELITAKEEGRLIVPPCKVGDTLWVVWSLTKSSKKYVYPVRVYALRYDDKKNNMRVCADGEFKIESYDGYYTHYYRGTFPQENVGKTVFLTREEAEAKLKGEQ